MRLKTYHNKKTGNVEALNMDATNYFFRTSETIGLIFLSFYDGSEQSIDFGRVGRSRCSLSIRSGAGNRPEEKILQEIKQFAESIGAIVSESQTK